MLQGINALLALPVLSKRPTIKLDSIDLPGITGRRVLVTGAGGSIGSEMVLQIASASPEKLLVLDHSEYALYQIMQTLDENHVPFPVVPALIDVRDPNAVREFFENHPVHTVLHAAAYKHVPLLETPENAIEGLRVNVVGTANMLEWATKQGARFVLVSTDKAAEPTSFMGLTKRLAELTLISMATRSGGRADFVRFGNVMGSSGSVIPLFQRQIAQGYAVTVTHPEMTRYFMTIRQAVELVLDVAGFESDDPSPHLFVLDMGEPVKIIDLARHLIEQAGLRPDIDIPIKITGIRPGEKLHEVLHFPYEQLTPSPIPGVSMCRPEFDHQRLTQIALMKGAVQMRDYERIRNYMELLVPEYGGQDPWWR